MSPQAEDLQDPSLYLDIPAAVKRLREAKAKKEKVLVFGDYDADGITAAAILGRVFSRLGIVHEIFIPERMRHGYGLRRSTLEKILDKDVRVLVTVDNGITALEEIAYLNERGIDSIIVDHHLPRKSLPAALALVSAERHARRAEEGKLAACGLAFKLAWALAGGGEAREHLDLVAIGTLADMAPLGEENRILASCGLRALGATRKKGLAALLDLLGLRGSAVASREVAFNIVPRINAAGRVGCPKDALALLLTDSDVEASNLARVLDENNRQRQELEQKAFSKVLAKVEMEHHFGRDAVIVVADEEWHEGVIGILAARLVERFHRPSFVISLKEGVGKGSGRTIPDFYLFENLSGFAGLFESFGGHSQACGLTIKEERIGEFRSAVNDAAKRVLTPEKLSPSISIDFEMPLDAVTEPLVEALSRLEPFGAGHPSPLFLSRGLTVTESPKTGKRRGEAFGVQDGSGAARAEAVIWNGRARVEAGDRIDVVYTPAFRKEKGESVLRLCVEDYRKSGA